MATMEQLEQRVLSLEQKLTENILDDDPYQSSHTGQDIDAAVTRALPGGDIDIFLAAINPLIWGLGGVGKRVTDLNDAQDGGLYSALGAANLPPNVESAQYGSVLVLCSQKDRVTQVYFNDVTGGTGAIAVRRLNGNGWSAWEFINPPMLLGVEYRTTERHLGKPVYKKRITVNPLPNASQLIIENVINPSTDSIFDLHSSFLDAISATTTSYPPFYGSAVAARAWVRSNGELVISTFADLSSSKAIVTLSYTKTTD